ncbi:unnamed protein product [Oikopleura dioica]|uniref:GRIP domain-containing protein n=1 Tax=Oikopleura dioica TaxID=34765 RepID=E4XP38_OIKDI|nr:unnamed protein product [Oikopleura dioica]
MNHVVSRRTTSTRERRRCVRSAERTRLLQDNESLQKSLEDVDAVHQEEIQAVLAQRDQLKSQLDPTELALTKSQAAEIQKLKHELDLFKRTESPTFPRSSSPTQSDIKPDIKLKMAKLQKQNKAKIQALEAKLKETEENCASYKTINEELEAKVAKNERDYLNLIDKEAEMKLVFEKQVKELTARVLNQEEKNGEGIAEVDEIAKEHREKTQELEKKLEAATRQNDESSDRIGKMKEFVEILKNKKDLLETELVMLKKQLEDTRTIAEAANDHTNIEKKLEFYMDKCQSLEAGVVMSDTAKKQAVDENERTLKALHLKEEELQKTETMKMNIQRHCQTLIEQAEKQAQSQLEIEAELEKLQNDKRDLVQSLTEQKERANELQTELKKTSKKLKNVENEHKKKYSMMETQLSEQVADISQKLEEADAKILGFKTMAVDNDEAQAAVADGISKLRRENSEKREQIQSLKDELDVSTKKLQNRLDGCLLREKDLKNKVSESKELVAQCEKEKSELAKKLKKAAKSDIIIADLRKQNDSLDKNFISQGHKLARIEEELNACQRILEPVNVRKIELEEKLALYEKQYLANKDMNIEKERDMYRESSLRLEKERGDLEQKLLEFERISGETQVAVAQMHAQNKDETKKLVELHEKTINKYEENIKELEEEVAEKMSRINELIASESSNTEQDEQIKLLRDSHKEELKRRDSLVKKMEEDRALLTQMVSEAKDRADTNEDSAEKFEKVLRQRNEAYELVKNVEEMLTVKTKRMEQLEEMRQSLEADLAEQTQEYEAETNSLLTAKAEAFYKLKTIEKELASEKKAKLRLKRDLEQDQKIKKLQSADLESEVTANLRQEIGNLTSKVKTKDDELSRMAVRLTTLEEAENLLFSKADVLEKQLSEERFEKGAVQEQARILAEKLEALKGKDSTVSADLEQPEKESLEEKLLSKTTDGPEIEKLNETIELLRDAESSMFSKIQSLEKELAEEQAKSVEMRSSDDTKIIEEIATLNAAIVSLREREVLLSSNIEGLEKMLVEEKDVTEKLDAEIGELRAELSSTLEQLEDAEAAAQEAGSLLEQLRAVEQANLALKDKLKTFENASTQATHLQSQIQQLQAAYAAKEHELATLQKQLLVSSENSESSTSIEILQSALIQREHQVEQAMKTSQMLEQQLRLMHEKQQEKLSDPDNMLEEQIAHLEAEKEYLQHVLKDHLVRAKDDEIEALNSKNQSLTEILRSDDASSHINSKLEEIDALNKRVIEQKQENGQLKDAVRKLETSCLMVNKQFDEYNEAIVSERVDMRSLISSHEQLHSQAEETELELAKLRIIVGKIRAHPQSSKIAESSSPSTVEINGDRDMLAHSVKNLRERCAGLEATNVAIKRDNDALRDQLMDRRDKWDNLELLNKKMAAEISSRDERLAEHLESIAELKANMNKMDQQLKDTEKDISELDRLRERLVQVDLDHSEELQLIQSNEERLQEQVDSLRSGLNDVTGARKDLEEKQQENARGQEIKEKQLLAELEVAKKRDLANEKSISELRQFIDNFRDQKELEAKNKARRHGIEIQRAQTEINGLRQEITQLQGRLTAAIAKKEESKHLELQLLESEEKFDRLRAVIDEKAIELDKSRKRLAEAREAAQKTIDKELAKNLLLKYIALPSAKKEEGHSVLQHVFGLSAEELEQATNSGAGWSSWLRAPRAVPVALDPNKSFSELLVNYLESNSQPSNADQQNPNQHNLPPLPANAMVGDIGRTTSSENRDRGIEGRNAFTSPSIMSPLMTPSSKHQNALLKGLLDDE